MRHSLEFEMSLVEHTAEHELWEENPSGLLLDHRMAQKDSSINLRSHSSSQ